MIKPTSLDIRKWMRKDLLHMKPYLPHRNIDTAENATWVDSNENPFATNFNRYPDPTQITLRQKLSKLKNVTAEQIFISHGSDEAIDLIVRAFCEPKNDSISVIVPGFEMYKHAAELCAVGVKTFRQKSPFVFDDKLVAEILNEQTKILFLCSPNNPTGKSIDSKILKKLIENWNGIVVLDEAYIDFAPYESRYKWIDTYANLIVLQTFSKAWGLAGLRIGMTFAHHEIINVLECIKIPYNVSQHSAEEALKALDNFHEQPKFIAEWLIEKQRLISKLEQCKQISNIYSSDANFMLVECKDGPALYTFLRQKGMFVRLRREPECANCLRISVGTQEENDLCVQYIQAFESEKLKAS